MENGSPPGPDRFRAYINSELSHEEAVEKYLRFGNSQPAHNQLHLLAGILRHARDYKTETICAGVYVDLARHPRTPTDQAPHLIERAAKRLGRLASLDWTEIAEQDTHLIYRGALTRAYADKYKKALSGQKPDMTDEKNLYNSLLEIGRNTLNPAAVEHASTLDVRGVQFEVGVHLLNARFNLRHGQIRQSVWPSLPREDDPHDFNLEYKTGWDMAVTRGDFLDQSSCQSFVQLKAVRNSHVYDPSITVIVGKEDLGTKTTADITVAALQEAEPKSPLHHKIASEKLNIIERRFLDKLGWRFED